MTKPQFLDEQVSALGRVSIGTWALVITLIVTLAGWGWATSSNAKELDSQRAMVEKMRDQKADKETINEQLDTIVKRLDDLKEDVREVRREQERVRTWTNRPKPSNSSDSSGTH